MKLYEALSVRKGLEIRIEQVKKRILTDMWVKEGDEPIEDTSNLKKELDGCFRQLQHIIYCLNKSNMLVKTEDGKTITELLAQRDVLSKRLKIMNEIMQTVSSGIRNGNDYGYDKEIKYVATIDRMEFRHEFDDLSRQYRELNLRIQQLNFMCDLIE